MITKRESRIIDFLDYFIQFDAISEDKGFTTNESIKLFKIYLDNYSE